MNYSLEDIYGSGIMNPTGAVSPTEYPYQDNLTDAYPLSTDGGVQAPVTIAQPPTPAVPSVVNTPEEVKIGNGSSVAASEKAIDFNNLDKLEKKSGIIDKRVAARMAPLDKEYNYQAGEQARISSDQAKVARGVTDIEKQKADLVAAHDIDQSRLIDEHNNAVAAEEERGRQRVQSAIDTHQRMLQDYMTSQVDPGMMWKNMTGGEKMGSGLSVFASAFLGAKGIDTPVMTMLDKALDRNIDAQLQNINIKGKALDEQGKMVQMVREQSASDLEAKLRLKDMALESGKYAIAAQMSQFGSKLAELKGQEVISNIEQNQLKFRQELVKERTGHEQIITGQEIQKRGDELQAAAAARSAKHQEDLLEYQKQKDSQKNVGDMSAALNARAVVDPTDPTKFLVAPENMDDKEVSKAQDAAAKYVNTLKVANELMEYNRALGKEYDGPLKDLTADVIRAKRDQLHTTLKNNLATQWQGTTYSDTWAKTLESVIPKQTYTFDVNTDQVLGQFIETMGSEAATMKASFYEPNEQERALYRPRVGSPLDSIGKIRSGEKDSSNTFAQPLVTGGKVANIAEKPQTRRVAEYVGRADEYHKNNVAESKVSEPVKADWVNRATLFGQNKEDLLDYGVPTSFIEMNNVYQIAKSGSPEEKQDAIAALTARADKIKEGLGAQVVNKYTKSLDDTELYTDSALDAQYFLKKLQAESEGTTFERKYLSAFANYKNVEDYHKDIK